MLGKMEMRAPPGSRPRDGRHCDLCGCSQPAVRCDKCGCQIFCLSCDDMYHRHPKRRFHLRKAVDPAPAAAQSRPSLPVKVAHLNATNPGDPSKMPLPPPRKKKSSLFSSFRRPSPSRENSPPLPKKEYSWTDRLGSIKKFMSNRPLPPLPNADDNDEDMQPTTNGQSSTRGDLSFIHKKSEERPPQLPARSPRPTDSPVFAMDPRIPSSHGNMQEQMRNGSFEPNANHMNHNREFSGEENHWNNRMHTQNQNQNQNQNGHHGFGTMNNRQNLGNFMPPGGPGFPGGMHQSSSATDLQNMHNHEPMLGAGGPPHPHYPHYPLNPLNPHMPPPHYPYPMYPQYPANYPQYFGNSFANLSNPPTTDGDFSDQSETPARHTSKKHPFRKRAKRSQSVMMDRMAYPGQQYYPFGPYPGYGPWGAPMPMEAPPSPASSIRSLNRVGRTRRRKKMTSEDDDEEFSMSSSPLSRPKSSSSERPTDRKDVHRVTHLPEQTTSSEDEDNEDGNRRRNKANTIQRRPSDHMKTPSSPATDRKRPPKMKKRTSSKQSDSELQDVPEAQIEMQISRDSSADQPVQPQQPSAPSPPSTMWECKHCTFINPIENRICQVCCKTVTPRTETPVTTGSRPSSRAEASNSRKQSVESEKICSSPEKIQQEQEEASLKKDKQDMAILNSALDEAEKEISRGLEELMKLKDDMDDNISKDKNPTTSKELNTENVQSSKPVYKSSGRMRTSILDKLTTSKAQTPKSTTASTSTEMQTGHNDWATDKIIEARRHSNSSTTSEAYNSPLGQSPELGNGLNRQMAQSPELGNSFNKQKRDSSCQTQEDNIAEYLERKRLAEETFVGRPVNNFGFGYGDRMDMVTSPVPAMYDRFFGGSMGMMQRSHSRASLFTGRMNDLGPMDYGGPGFGYGAAPMYRSVSRSSLTGDYPDARMPEFHNLRKPDYYLSMEELVERRRQETVRAQGLELVRMIREAEQQGFTADDIQVALTHCGKQSPMEWLQDNWRNMLDSVVTLSTNYGNDKKENDIGVLSESEARDALRLHKGNIWAAVTECVEGRQRKYLELSARGKFSRKDIVDALTSSEGEVEMAYAKLSKTTGKPFLMRIWGAGEGVQNQDGAQPVLEDLKDIPHNFQKDEFGSDDLSDDLWSEDGGEVEWEEEEEYEEERDFEDLQTCRDDLQTDPQDMRTPESDRSDYCDAFALEDRNMSSPSDDIFFVIPEAKQEKKRGFLSKLAALRKDSKELVDPVPIAEDVSVQSLPAHSDDLSLSSAEPPKNNGALSALKNTFSAIKETVTGSSKVDKKAPCSQPERRTIIVRGQLDHEPFESNSSVELTSVKALKDDSTDHAFRNKHIETTSVKTAQPNVEKSNFIHDADKKDKYVIVNQKEDRNVPTPNQNKGVKSAREADTRNKTENKKPQSLAERLKFAKQAYSSRTNLNTIDTLNDNSIPSTSKLNTSLIDGKSLLTTEGNKLDGRSKQETLTSIEPSRNSNPEADIKDKKSNISLVIEVSNLQKSRAKSSSHTDNSDSVDVALVNDRLSAKDKSKAEIKRTSPIETQILKDKDKVKTSLVKNSTETQLAANVKEKSKDAMVETKATKLVEHNEMSSTRFSSEIDTSVESKSIPQSTDPLEPSKIIETQKVIENIPANLANIAEETGIPGTSLENFSEQLLKKVSGSALGSLETVKVVEVPKVVENISSNIENVARAEVSNINLGNTSEKLLEKVSTSTPGSLEPSKVIEVKKLIENIPSNIANTPKTMVSDSNLENSSKKQLDKVAASSHGYIKNNSIKSSDDTLNEANNTDMKTKALKEEILKGDDKAKTQLNEKANAQAQLTENNEIGIKPTAEETLPQSAELKSINTFNSASKMTNLKDITEEFDKKQVNNLDKTENSSSEAKSTNKTIIVNVPENKGDNKTERPETLQQVNNSSQLLENKQEGPAEIQSSQTTEIKALDLPERSLPSNSQNAAEKINVEVSKTQLNQEGTKNEQNFAELGVSVSNSSTQNIECNTTAVGESPDKPSEPSVSHRSSEDKDSNSKLIQNNDRPEDNNSSKDTNTSGSNAAILEANKQSTSIPSTSDGTKSGKSKITKTGKLKKSKLLNKDIQNLDETKCSIKSETPLEAAVGSNANSNTENNKQVGDISIVASSENKIAASNGELNNKVPGSIASLKSEDSSSKVMGTEVPTKEVLTEHPSNEKNSTNTIVADSKILTTEQVPKVITNQEIESRSDEILESPSATSILQNKATDSQELKHSTTKYDEPKTSVEIASSATAHAVSATEEPEPITMTKSEQSPTTSTVISSSSTDNSTVEIPSEVSKTKTVNSKETFDNKSGKIRGFNSGKISSATEPSTSTSTSGSSVDLKTIAESSELPKSEATNKIARASGNSVDLKAIAELSELPKSEATSKTPSASDNSVDLKTIAESSELPKSEATSKTASASDNSIDLKAITESPELPKSEVTSKTAETATSSATPSHSQQHSITADMVTDIPSSVVNKEPIAQKSEQDQSTSEKQSENSDSFRTADSDDTDIQFSDESRPSSVTPPSPVDALRNRFEGFPGGLRGPVRPQSPFRRMSFNSRKQVIALERIRDTAADKPWFHQKAVEPVKTSIPKRTIKQQLEMERRVRKMVSDRKCRTYRKAEIVVQLMDMNFEEEEAIQASNECSTLEKAISYLQQECQLCAGHFAASQIISMTHCQHRACCECIRAYFTVQIRDRTILDLLCPFCNEPDIGDEDVAQDYFNHLDIMLKKLVDVEIHELFQRKLRDRVLMKDPNFMWCSQCSSGFIAMPNLKRLVCPDCNAVTCASCRRLWTRDHQGISCEAYAAMKDACDLEGQTASIAKMLTEDGIECPRCHFRYALAKGGCMHFRCIQCQHDFCSGCYRPFKMGQKCGVSEFCAKLGLHAHHPRNCLFYLRDKEPEDLQKLLDMNDVKYNKEPSEGVEVKATCQVMEQKETSDGMVDDFCGKDVQDGYAGLCRLHYVEYLGQLVNKHEVDPIQIFDNDDLELVLRRANIRLPPKRYRENDAQYREKLVNVIREELPLDKMDGS